MEDIIDQISEVKKEILNVRDEKVLDHEWNTINQFIDAMSFALEIIIDAYYEDDYDIKVTETEEDEDDEGEDEDEEDEDDEAEDEDEDDGHDEL
jgi:hypothetical protein